MVTIGESNKCNEGMTKISKQIQTTAYKYIYGVYSVIRHQTSMAKSRDIGECERAAIFHLRVAGHSSAEIAKKSTLHEVKSIQNYAKA